MTFSAPQVCNIVCISFLDRFCIPSMEIVIKLCKCSAIKRWRSLVHTLAITEEERSMRLILAQNELSPKLSSQKCYIILMEVFNFFSATQFLRGNLPSLGRNFFPSKPPVCNTAVTDSTYVHVSMLRYVITSYSIFGKSCVALFVDVVKFSSVAFKQILLFFKYLEYICFVLPRLRASLW
jgi:hypothetical protein